MVADRKGGRALAFRSVQSLHRTHCDTQRTELIRWDSTQQREIASVLCCLPVSVFCLRPPPASVERSTQSANPYVLADVDALLFS